ncbi:MAG: trypsin-like peptidase domain-containing protein [Candidatus Nealsonbacteria bacterium]|nr:trypsin-like peptidase domain-containing protein [Candidatus Nealsonbacteria bacterium]
MLLTSLTIAVAQTDDAPQTPTAPTAAESTSTAADAVLAAEADRVAVMDKAKDAVLAVFASNGRGGGSGVVITADGYALTNFHVVKPCGNAMKCGMADGELYDAVVVGLDPTGDVALIKLLGRDDFPHAELGDSDRMQVGDWCFAMGNPFLLATDFLPTATYGIVSGMHRYQYPAGTLLEYADCIQTDASINPGNSGGPLFDAQGRLIGINGRGSFEKRGRVNVGVAYAISINQIKNFLGYLHSGRIVDHATLGAQVNFDVEGRVVVSNILEESDAYRRGLRYDDEIVSFGGRPISTPNGFKNVLGIYPKGWRIPLSFRREGQRYDVFVRLGGVHRADELIKKTAGRPRPIRIDPGKNPKPGEKPKDEKPKPGEKPKIEKAEKPEPDKPKPLKKPVPPPGNPHGHQPMQPQAPTPEAVKKHFEAKRGYANYYFNKLHRQRVFDAWSARGDFSGLAGTWTLSGELEHGGEFSLLLTDADAALKLATSEWKWTATDDFSASIEPPQSGGLLPAWNLWRRLAVTGLDEFGDVSYLGTAPLPGHEGLVDVLVGLHKGVECRFMFDPAEGVLLAIEFFPEEQVDPCEIYFSEHRRIDGRHLPGRIEVRVGDESYATFKLNEFNFEKTPAKDAANDSKDKKTTED